MIRHFCDRCGTELAAGENAVSRRLVRKLDQFTIEVHVAVDNTWNKGELCAACVVAIVNEGEPSQGQVYRAGPTSDSVIVTN